MCHCLVTYLPAGIHPSDLLTPSPTPYSKLSLPHLNSFYPFDTCVCETRLTDLTSSSLEYFAGTLVSYLRCCIVAHFPKKRDAQNRSVYIYSGRKAFFASMACTVDK